jgi:hypothetical protein
MIPDECAAFHKKAVLSPNRLSQASVFFQEAPKHSSLTGVVLLAIQNPLFSLFWTVLESRVTG